MMRWAGFRGLGVLGIYADWTLQSSWNLAHALLPSHNNISQPINKNKNNDKNNSNDNDNGNDNKKSLEADMPAGEPRAVKASDTKFTMSQRWGGGAFRS